jgi:hypothetical protein
MNAITFDEWDKMMLSEDGEHFRIPYEERRERWLRYSRDPVFSGPRFAYPLYLSNGDICLLQGMRDNE